jgi:hypothetical protein
MHRLTLRIIHATNGPHETGCHLKIYKGPQLIAYQ